MNILYLRITCHGVGNVYCNIIIILIWIIKSLKYDKLILINWHNRKDLFHSFSNPILNEKIEFINTDSDRWNQELVKINNIVSDNLALDKHDLTTNFPSNFTAHYSKLYNNTIYYCDTKNRVYYWRLGIRHDGKKRTGIRKRNNIMSLKKFVKLHLNKDICKFLNNSNNVTDIFLHHIKSKKEDLLIAKKYFDLQPNKLLTDHINNLKKKMGNYISIHLRSTDLISNKRIVSRRLIKFFNFIDHNPGKNIYLATDCEKYQKTFLEKYKGKVFFFEKISENHIEREVRNTSNISIYMDLFMCRDSIDFLGTPESTFSTLIKILRFNKQK